MLIIRRILLVFVASLFTTLLFLTAWDFGVMRTIGTPGPVKKTLSDSGIYDSVLTGLLNQAKENTSSSGDVSLIDPVIQKAANASFTPQVLQQNTEKILDSTYKWLNGDSPTPDFKIDLSSVKTSFASNVASGLQDKLATLPVCTTAASKDNFDALTASCLPKGMTTASAANNVKTSLLSGQGFLDNPVITANDLKANGSNTSIFTDKLKKAPDYFSWIKKVPYILIGLTLLTGALIVLLSATKSKGLRKIGFTLVIVGVLMLVFAWGSNYLLTKKAIPKLSLNNNAVMQEKIQILAKDLTQEIDKTFWMFGIAYTVLGAAAIAYPMISGRSAGSQKGNKRAAAEDGEPEHSAPETPAHAPTHQPAEPKKRTIDIQ